jgi:AbrB family looped-hinge helix DNA binding protein
MTKAIVRARRQITIPAEFCAELNIRTGDELILEVQDGKLRMTPTRKIALDALTELNRLFQESGITEEELLASGRQIRSQLTRERYGRRQKRSA